MFDLHEALRYVVENDGSDLHVKVPARPMARFRGHLEPLPQYQEALTPAEAERVLRQMLAEHSDKMAAFDSENEIDFSYTVPDLARFRVNAFRQRGSVSIVARVIPFTVRTIAELGLPSVIEQVADEERGLILLTGTTGSGKSTTLAAIINFINQTKARHIVTIENRIIDFFQPHEQTQARAMLAGTLRAVVSQRLVQTVDRKARVAVCEILRMTGRARDMIIDPEQTDRLREVIAEGAYYGMQTFDQALLEHYQGGRVSMEDAMRVASSPHDFKLLVAGEGRTATSMNDLTRREERSEPAAPAPSREPAPVTAAGPGPANGRPSAPPPGLIG